MTDPMDAQRDTPARPIGSVGDVERQVTTDLSDEGESGLPAHEIDSNETVGGGVMSEGGTAVDRGTGTLNGQAQIHGGDDGIDDETALPDAGVGIEDD